MKEEIVYIHFETVDSTNNWVKAHAGQLDPHALSCISAASQTAGRGRFKRTWISPKGENIYATFFLTIPKEASYLANLGQILGYSCVEVLRKLGFSPELKWPNDILLRRKKVAGILVEALSVKEGLGIVLGIGINVNTEQEILEIIDRPAISLQQVQKKPWKREQILQALAVCFRENFLILCEKGFSYFHPLFEEILAYKGERIQCSEGPYIIEGVCKGVSVEGFLKLTLDSGEERMLHSGEIIF